MISDLERVGDYAMYIVELSPYLSAAQLAGKAHRAEMALAAVDMVKQSVQAFVDGDVQLAARVKAVSYTHLDVYKRQAGAC